MDVKIFIILCSFQYFSDISVEAALEMRNVALQGTASQSSNYTNHLRYAPSAIDGIIGSGFTHTSEEVSDTFHWWKVNLENQYLIEKIVVYNRLDCC